jgi:hypothetical protein
MLIFFTEWNIDHLIGHESVSLELRGGKLGVFIDKLSRMRP